MILGVIHSAAGVPRALQQQILMLMSTTVLKTLYHRVFSSLPYANDTSSLPPLDSDREDIATSLSSTGLRLAKQVIQEQQDARNIWISGHF
jgi:hypothetical protein